MMIKRRVITYLKPEIWKRFLAVLGATGDNRYKFAQRAIENEIERLEAEMGMD